MMPISDRHLEAALSEYNDKVNELETGGTREQLLEAYVNRACILSMMESYVSALADFDDAIELIGESEVAGEKIDAGTYVRAFVGRGQLLYSDDGGQMRQDYIVAASRLKELKEGVRHYDRKSIIRMCIGCAEDLVDEGYPEDAVLFISKSISMIGNNRDDWFLNRLQETQSLLGQSFQDRKMHDDAVAAFSESIETATELMEYGHLDDPMSVIYSLVARGDVESECELPELMLADYCLAADLMEGLNSTRKLDDIELLINLHQEIAKVMMGANKISEAEKHLVRAMELGVGGAKDYISLHSDREE
jgi:tetratricopeptide (TPR) repeat protein